MSDKTDKPFVLTQLEEALEERQGSDRRQNEEGLSPEQEDRRKGNRREEKTN